MGALKTESRRRLDALNSSIAKMKSSTWEAAASCDQLTKRARQLDSLTSPASDASSLLSKASGNLGSTLVLMKDAREKFDTIKDCEPAIERLHRGIVTLQDIKSGKAKKAARANPFGNNNNNASDNNKENNAKDKDNNNNNNNEVVLSEQDVYAAADSMEIIRDAYDYFLDRKHWRSSAQALTSLERVHQMGVSSMCILESFHLIDSGQAVRIKRVVKQEGEEQITPANETAQQVSKLCKLWVCSIYKYTQVH
jgi:exocyst complex component 7